MQTIIRDRGQRVAKVRVKQENTEYVTQGVLDSVTGYRHGGIWNNWNQVWAYSSALA